jgi:hypothetical protein
MVFHQEGTQLVVNKWQHGDLTSVSSHFRYVLINLKCPSMFKVLGVKGGKRI